MLAMFVSHPVNFCVVKGHVVLDCLQRPAMISSEQTTPSGPIRGEATRIAFEQATLSFNPGTSEPRRKDIWRLVPSGDDMIAVASFVS